MVSINTVFSSIEQAYRKTEALFRSFPKDSVDTEAVISECMKQFDHLYLEQGSEIALSAYFRYLLGSKGFLRDTPFNFMLVEDAYADSICAAFFEALRIITGKRPEVLTVDERTLLQAPEEELRKLGRCNVYVIRNCNRKPMSPGETAAWQLTAELFARTPCIVKLLRAPKEVIETRFREFDHIYFRVFRHKLNCRTASTEDIERSLLLALEKKGFSRTLDFETELHVYLEVVYPKADLRNYAFVNDMVERIVSKYYERQRSGLVLDADCVPFYRRPAIESLEEASPSEAAYSPQDTVDEYAVKNGPVIRNILIVSLSTFAVNHDGGASKLSTCTYLYQAPQSETAEEGTYCYQQEPFPMHLKEKLKDAGEILMLTTRETRTPVLIDVDDKSIVISPQDYFIGAVHRIPDLENVIFKSVEVEQEAPAEAVSAVVGHLREVNKNNREEKETLHIYLGTNGGLRGIQLILEAILSLLSTDGISLNSADVWSLRQEARNRYVIYNSAAEFRIFDLVSGINEFQNYGRIHSLERFITAAGDATALKLLSCLKAVSEGIQFCSIQSYHKGLEELSRFYGDNPKSADPYIQMFLNNIKNDFSTLLAENHEIISEIKWCAKKGFYQQAFTLIENSMPTVYCQKGMVYFSPKLETVAADYKQFGNDGVEEFLYNSVINNQFMYFIRETIQKHKQQWKEPQLYPMIQKTHTPSVKVVFNTSPDVVTTAGEFRNVLLAHREVKKIRNDLMHNHELKNATIEDYHNKLTEYIVAAEKLVATWNNKNKKLHNKKLPPLLILSLKDEAE